MDPVSALSLAANVVQFVVWGQNIVSKGNQLYKSADGALAENVQLETASIRLQQLSGSVQGSLSQAQQGVPTGSLAQSDQALEKICEECVAMSKELVDKLEKLKVPEGHPHKKWKSLRQALKSVWSKEKVEEISERLAALRTELDTHVITSIREHVTSMSIQNDVRFTSLDNDAKNIIKTFLVSKNEIQADMESRFNALNLSVEAEHAKTREALKHQAEDRYIRKAELHILESLAFETMAHRYENIHEAHRQTFEWIFRDPPTGTRTWSNFISWAESDSGIYWITGKAGCGKSTLMRFIVDDPRTREHLEYWAPSEALDTPAFFFWNSGVQEQRSQAGLLRSILHEVLQKHTNLIPVVFPAEWRKALELSKHEVPAILENWSLSRLQKAFKALVRCSCENLRLCFFIDGLDEYEGDHEQISDYFSDLSGLPYVKFCIASRPLIVFKDAFSTCPSLRLQDLTSNDIQKYIEDKLNGHKRMKFLTKQSPVESGDLVQQVIYKAEGVFLWVTLVVTSLIKGLSQRDGIPQLMKRLNSFPSDLELLYEHMLGSIDPIYIEDGSRIFQVFREESSASLEIFYIALITDLPRVLGIPSDDLEMARKEEVKLLHMSMDYEISDSEFETEFDSADSKTESSNSVFNRLSFSIYSQKSLFEYMDDRVRTRCGGLIECTKYGQRNAPRATLEYIHRTVRDYLNREDIWTDLCRHTAHLSGFDPCLQLLMARVLSLKRLLLREDLQPAQIRNVISILWEGAYECAWIVEDNQSDLDIGCRLLNEFDHAAIELSQRACSLEEKQPMLTPHWSNYKIPAAWESNFLCETVRSNIPSYVRNHFALYGPTKMRTSGLPILAFAFLARGPLEIIEDWKVIEILIENGADPNEIYEGHTVWQYFVHHFHANFLREEIRGKRDYIDEVKKCIRKFMETGVDLDVCCIKDGRVWKRVYSGEVLVSNAKLQLDGDLENLRYKLARHTDENGPRLGDRESLLSVMSGSTGTISEVSTGFPSSSEEFDVSKRTEEPDSDVNDEQSEADEGGVLSEEAEVRLAEDPLFEEHHSLTTIIKELFETKNDPHGADELLELMARLKAAKAATEEIQSQPGLVPE